MLLSSSLTYADTIIYEAWVDITFYDPFDPKQTGEDPGVGAWNYKIKKGDRIIAISRDLEKLGLTNGKKVYIDDFGTYMVRDRMNKRWKSRIDIAIYEGKNLKERRKIARKKGIIKNRRIIWKISIH